MSTKKRKKTKRKGTLSKFFIVLLIIALAVAFSVYSYFTQKLDMMVKGDKIEASSVGISDETMNRLKEYKNIALLGIDSRSDDYGLGNRSDCIIIASINNTTGGVKLISVYRDTYVDVEENGKVVLDKITHAYSYGKAQNTLKSLNEAMDLNITEYIAVNFDAVTDAVDALNGVTINVTQEELKYINPYINETASVTGKQNTPLSSAGEQTLNGVQAVAYGRIRYTSGGDYKRTERMRTVIEAMLKKAKTLNIGQLNNFANVLLPKISTNISSNEILGMVAKLATLNINSSIGWPYTTKGITLDRWYGIPCTLESNVIKLHKEVFNEEDYVASDKVKDMSNRIQTKTGYGEISE